MFGSTCAHPLAAHPASMKAHSIMHISMIGTGDEPIIPNAVIRATVGEMPLWHLLMLRSQSSSHPVRFTNSDWNDPDTLPCMRSQLTRYLIEFQCPWRYKLKPHGDIHHFFQQMDIMKTVCNVNTDQWALRIPWPMMTTSMSSRTAIPNSTSFSWIPTFI